MEFSLPSLLSGDLLVVSIIITIAGAAFYYFKALITITNPIKEPKEKDYIYTAFFFLFCGIVVIIHFLFSEYIKNLSYRLWLLFIVVIGMGVLILRVDKLKNLRFDLFVTMLISYALILILLQPPFSFPEYLFQYTTMMLMFLLFLFLTAFALLFGYSVHPSSVDASLHLENGEKLDGKIVRTSDKFVKILSPSYLFSWDDIIMGNTTEFIKFLKDVLKIEGVENTAIKKSDNKETITVTHGKNSITLKLNKKEKKMNLEISGGKIYEYKEENGKSKIYDITTHLVNLDKIIEIEIPPTTKPKR